jgi:ATP-dependent DNA helicase RecQ
MARTAEVAPGIAAVSAPAPARKRAARLVRPEPDAPAATGLQRAEEVLKRVWGYAAFRSHQAPIIEALVEGRDVLALMPTGGGKSLCYQIPSLVRPGCGIVVSPLIALMQDQVSALRELGVKCAFLNSTLDWREAVEVERALVEGQLDLLYVAPERLLSEKMLGLLERSDLALFAIDEAHCVSQWGHDFRPEYRQLSILSERFPHVPRVALTATADIATREEIADELRLREPARFVASFDRPNIRYMISDAGDARERLWRFLESEHAADAGIVYCLSRKKVEEVADWLTHKGRVALAYHAGLPPDVRRRVQERFQAEEGVIVVATIAFGMGIDKPDVRFVAHLSLPKSIEAYYQETGRGGRDGEPADAWMSYGLEDVITLSQFIAQSEAGEERKRVERQKLDALIGICELSGCRRQALLAYFGETGSEPCGNCDNCLSPPQTVDGTVNAQKALSTVYRTGQSYAATYCINVLRGKTDERIVRNGHDQVSTFGIGADVAEGEWRAIFRQLVTRGFLVADIMQWNTLHLTESSRALLKGEEQFFVRHQVRLPKAEKGKKQKGKAAAAVIAAADQPLWTALKALRSRLASEGRVPPYVICHDRSIADMVQLKPRNADELKMVNGMGEAKVAKYGRDLLAVIREHKGSRAA